MTKKLPYNDRVLLKLSNEVLKEERIRLKTIIEILDKMTELHKGNITERELFLMAKGRIDRTIDGWRIKE